MSGGGPCGSHGPYGPGPALGLGHHDHPLLGQAVLDTATGRTGILRAICPEPENRSPWQDPALRPGDGPPKAWLAPMRGGREWMTEPDALAPPDSAHSPANCSP